MASVGDVFSGIGDAFSDIFGAAKERFVEQIKGPQAGASGSQYNQQLPAVDATGKPISAPAPGGNQHIMAWISQNWLIILLVLLLIWLAIRMKWI